MINLGSYNYLGYAENHGFCTDQVLKSIDLWLGINQHPKRFKRPRIGYCRNRGVPQKFLHEQQKNITKSK